MPVYNIRNFNPLDINAKCNVIVDDNNGPIIFLIDEYHHHIGCIDGNIEIATELIRLLNVQLICVEGYDGGYRYDYERKCYNRFPEDYISNSIITPYPNPNRVNRIDLNELIPLSDDQRFSNAMIQHGILMKGIDCAGYYDEIGISLAENRYTPEYGAQIHLFRSYHFLRTCLTEYNRAELNGNIILNCGSNHNTDICNMYNQHEIDAVAGLHASYYRITSALHPNYDRINI